MVGIGISSASAGSDAVSLAKSSRSSSSSSSDGSGGFSDALSNSGNGRDANATSKAAADANSADTGGSQGDGSQAQDDTQQPAASAATAATGSGGKVSDGPKAQGAAQSFAQSLTAMPQPAPAVADMAAPTPDATASTATAADIAQQLAAMVDGDASGQPVTDAKGNLPAVKGGKTATADKDGDEDPGASAATAATGTISDALSLLGAALPATVVPAQTAASVLAAAGQLHSGNGKVAPGTAGSIDAVSSDAVGDKADAVATGMAMLASATVGNGGTDAGTATDDDDATQSFSLARANSKVQAQDLAAGKNADDAAQLDLKTAAGDGTGSITVLESRRFVGLADGSNSSLVANSLTGNKDWAAAMAPSAALTGASATTSASKVMNTLKIQMNPDNLGIVTATMRLSGDQLSVDLKVQSAEAYRQLSNDQSAMVDSLRQQGYSVDRITVSYTAPDTSSNSQPGYQGQQQQQQSGTSQGQGSEAQGRKQNSGQQAGDQDAVWGTGNVAADDNLAGSAQRARAGGVYL